MSDKKNKRPRRRKSALLDIMNGLLSLLVLGMLVAGGLFLYGVMQFYADGQVPEGTTFYVEEGDGLISVANRLQEEGLISNALIFRIGSRALKVDTTIPHGDFALPANASMAAIAKQITEGEPIEYTVTIPEGFTSWQVAERLRDEELLTGEIEEIPAEGSLLPNTYNFRRGDERGTLIARMQEAHDAALAEIWAGREADLPIGTPEELVTLASIVEKETGVAAERPQVASVFINRLGYNMRLQSDPTIIYGITQGEGTLGRGLRRSEIEQETAYNTYQIDGLPPGPIANPGIEAMRAVANPADTEYLYFVAAGATPDRGHLFATNYDDHRVNVRKWRAIEREAAEEAESEAEAAREALEAEEAAGAPASEETAE